MIIHLDTSVLVDALCAPFGSLRALRQAVSAGDSIAFSTVVLYEWLHGPRQPAELDAQQRWLPMDRAVPFDSAAADTAARVYRDLPRGRGREVDIMIAACAIEEGASLWTLNPHDFEDIPGLTLYRAR